MKPVLRAAAWCGLLCWSSWVLASPWTPLTELPLGPLRSADQQRGPQPAPPECLAPRRQRDLLAYFRQGVPSTAAPAGSAQAKAAGVGRCVTVQTFFWPGDLPHADPVRALKEWLNLVRIGGRVEWSDFSNANIQWYGLTYRGRYYFVKWLSGPEYQLEIVRTAWPVP